MRGKEVGGERGCVCEGGDVYVRERESGHDSSKSFLPRTVLL